MVAFLATATAASAALIGAPGGSAVASAPGRVGQAHAPVPGQYIVTLRDGVTTQGVAPVAGDLARHHGASVLHVYTTALHGFAARMSDTEAAALRADPRVARVVQDGYVHANATQSPAPWGLDRIDQRDLPLDNSYSPLVSGASVHAYVVDTGIRVSHQDFAGRASVGVDEIGDGQNGIDCNGHGTHVAGILGGTTFGVAKGVSLVSVRVLDCTGTGTDSQVIAGLDWVTAHAIRPAVVNMSLGGSLDPPLDTAVQNSIATGLSYAIAAGNSGADACATSPADVSQALVVAATDTADSRPSWSNYGSCVKLFAPGVNITSDWDSSDTATATLSGTSMATPHVAGSIALYLDRHPSATPAQVAAALTSTATLDHVVNPGTGSPNALDYIGFLDTAHPGEVITAVGASRTERLMDTVLAATNEANIHASQVPARPVPADASCAAVTYGATSSSGVVASPAGTDAGRDALRGSVAGTWPDATADAGKGCVDIARSDAPPRLVSASGDNASFEYYAYGLDAVTWASTSLNAPAALTQAQLQGIYHCTYTDWSQVGGSPGPIQRILPPDGSGVLVDFLTADLGVTGVAALPTSAAGCPAIERIGEDQGYDLFHGSRIYGPAGDASAFPNAILPFSAGTWTYQASHDTNPTIDVRSGVRPGGLLVDQGTNHGVAAQAVLWTGSNWALDTATVVGNATQVHNTVGLGFTQFGTTATATAGTFTSADVGKTIDSPDVYPGTTITAVVPDGSSATISPGAATTGTADAAIGSPVVSEATTLATIAPFPGVHYLANVIDNTEPSYVAARALIGFQDASGGVQSSLCNGGHAEDILDNGFLPLAAQTSPGGNVGVTCRLATPTSATPGVITGSGSTIAALPMQFWNSTAQTDGLSVNYLPTRSADGMVGYANGIFDFAATELEYSELPDPTIADTRGYQYLPDFAWGIGIAFHANDTNGNPVTSLRLSARTIAGIFTGTITSWADPAITADNGGVALPNQPLRIAYQSGQTGSTAYLYDYIAHTAPDIFTPWAQHNGLPTAHRFDSLDGIPNPGFTGVALNGADQLGQYLASPSGLWAIGDLPFGYAAAYGAPVASVRNAAGSWVAPSADAITAALRGATLNRDLSVDLAGAYSSPNPAAYPLSTYSYLVTQCASTAAAPTCRGPSPSVGTITTLASYLRSIACAGQTNLPFIGDARLPGNLSQTVADAIGRLQGTPPETLTAANCANPSF